MLHWVHVHHEFMIYVDEQPGGRVVNTSARHAHTCCKNTRAREVARLQAESVQAESDCASGRGTVQATAASRARTCGRFWGKHEPGTTRVAALGPRERWGRRASVLPTRRTTLTHALFFSSTVALNVPTTSSGNVDQSTSTYTRRSYSNLAESSTCHSSPAPHRFRPA